MHEKYAQVSIRDEISFKLFAGKSSKSASDIRDAANVPIWLTNTGLECRQAGLTYSELAAEVISALDEAGNIASIQRPKANREAR